MTNPFYFQWPGQKARHADEKQYPVWLHSIPVLSKPPVDAASFNKGSDLALGYNPNQPLRHAIVEPGKQLGDGLLGLVAHV